MFDNLSRPGGITGVIVSHDPWCPMAYGEGTECARGCHPKLSFVGEATLIKTMERDFRNRAQRRADAKKKGGAK